MIYLPPYRRNSILLSFILCPAIFSHAQQGGHIFYNLTTANGLSSNRTTSVIEDREGFYWIATQDGLNRFDGSSCKVYRNIKNDSSSLSHNHCINLLEDDNGDIWIGTVRGLNRYKKKEGKFERFYFHHPDINFDRVNSCKGLAKDNVGNIWFSSYGLWKFNITSGIWKQFVHDSTDITSIPSGITAYLTYDRLNNGLWMSGTTSYILLDLRSGKFYSEAYNPRKLAIFSFKSYAEPFAIDSESNLWCGDHDRAKLFRFSIRDNKIQYAGYKNPRGILRLSTDDKNRVWSHFWNGGTFVYDLDKDILDTAWLNYFHPQSALTDNSNNLYIDKAGNYWFCSFKGISIFNPEAQSVKYFSLPGNKRNYEGSEMIITSIAEQNENILWVGTDAGLYRYDLKKNDLKYIDEVQVNSNLVRSVYLQGDSVLWIGGHAELIRYDIIHGKLLKKIPMPSICWSIRGDIRDNIWVVTWSAGVFQFSGSGNLIRSLRQNTDPERGLSTERTLSLSTDRQPDVLWVGYNGGGGFSRVSNGYLDYEHFKIQYSSPHTNSFNTINCILQDYEGNLWMGTYGGGVVFYDTKKKEFSDYTQSDGLKGNFINSILMDDSSRLWISSSNGLNILDTKNHLIINSDIDLRFTNDDLIPNSIQRKNKKFLFFSGKIIVEVDPVAFLKPPAPAILLVGALKIFNEEISLPVSDEENKTIRLSHKQNYFSFDYSLLKPNPNAPVQYAYQLEGFDKDWNYVKERRSAFFTNVPAGNYAFRVKALDNRGRWSYFSEPVLIQIIPPFWQRWWFIGAVISFITAGLYIFYRYRIDQLKKILAIRTRISQDLHDEVGATLSSIHIYSSVAAKAMNKDTDETKNAIHKINENTRQVMENMSDIVWAISTDNGNETTLAAKLKNYGYDLLTPLNIKCVYLIDKEAEKKLVNLEARKNVLLIAKEAINNIGKYSGATEACIRLEITGRDLELEITDNGNGISSENIHTGYGINNMRQRAEAMNGTFQINSEIDKGTRICCTIPLPNIRGH